MAINDIVQTIAEARVDARSLSEFVFKPAGFKVTRRLAPTIDTLQFYVNSLSLAVTEAQGKVEYIETTVQDAINNTAVEGGVLADTFLTVTPNGAGTVARAQREKNADRTTVKDYGAIGDGTLHTVAEWTVLGSRVYYPDLAAIQAQYPHVTALTDSIDWAAIQANINAKVGASVEFTEGSFIVNKEITIPSGIVFNGASQHGTFLICNMMEGLAIHVTGGFYDKPVMLSNMTLRNSNFADNNCSGIKVTTPSAWGNTINVSNFTMQYFGGVNWDFHGSFNCVFNSVTTIGIENKGTLLKFSKVETFANQFLALNSVFFFGRMSIQNLGCVSSVFVGCTFEHSRLFLNVESLAGYSVFMTFIGCWFEIIQAGIVNSKLAPNSLLPIEPIENRQPIERIRFSGNYPSASLPTNFVSPITEPFRYKYFGVVDGYNPSRTFNPQFLTFDYSNGLPVDATVREIIKVFDLTELYNPTGFFSRQHYTVKITATVQSGEKIYALFSLVALNTTPALIGTIHDPYNNGVTYEVELAFSASNQLQVKVNAKGLNKIIVDVCSFGTLA